MLHQGVTRTGSALHRDDVGTDGDGLLIDMGATRASVVPDDIATGRRTTRRTGHAGMMVMALALLAAFATFLILGGLTPVQPTHYVVIATLCVNILFALVLLGIIGWEVWTILRARRMGWAGAQLHGRIVMLFTLIAAAPGILLALVAFVTIDRSFDGWYSSRVIDLFRSSNSIAQAYREEQIKTTAGDAFVVGIEVDRLRFLFDTNRAEFENALSRIAAGLNIGDLYLLHGDGSVELRISQDESRQINLPTPDMLSSLGLNDAAVRSPGSDNLIGSMLRLSAYDNMFLYLVRSVDEEAERYISALQAATDDYANIAERRLGIQIAYSTMYLVIALTLTLVAVWIGLAFADRLVAPVRRLVIAADQVAGGNLYVQVPVEGREGGEGDLGGLSRTFNNMTGQLRAQRNALLEASEQIDRRRRFTEAMLAGVGAGIIGVDAQGRITLLNRSAERLLGRDEAQTLGESLIETVPELEPLFQEAQAGRGRLAQGSMEMSRAGRDRILTVRITSERSEAQQHGYVVTLDDITDLVTAQRTSAWADVARRIAHEIKNPLTPIQLSIERIRRKYGKVIVEDRDVFDQCTETVVRQVDDIRRMVDEFSSFARMPKPVIALDDLGETVRQVVTLMRVGSPGIEIDLDMPETPLATRFDRRLISQAMTNIVKNATEAIAAVPEDQRQPGRIEVVVRAEQGQAIIDVIDNGIGLPAENRSRLLEPYMTTREKGTGLGLAIVAKILEDHGGALELLDAPAVAQGGRGAMMRLRFPLDFSPDSSDSSTTLQS